jgi:hypothetical protein
VTVDGRAALTGAAVVLAVAVPVATLASVLLDEGDALVFVAALLVLVALGAAGWVAAAQARTSPLPTAVAAALAGFAVAQTLSIVLAVAGDDDVNPGAVVFNALLAANAGLLGGWLAGRR